MGPLALIEAALAAWRQILSAPFRRLLGLSLGLTLFLLVIVWLALTRLFDGYLKANTIAGAYPVLDTVAYLLAGAGLIIALIYMLPAVSALVAGYFVDDAAARVEALHYSQDPPGVAMSVGRSLVYGARFAALSLIVNIAALLLLFVPGINLIAFFAANAYLLGREYFEMAAARFHSLPEAAAMRARNRTTVFMAGMMIAMLVAVPVLNLLTPMFGIALMVHVHKALARREARLSGTVPMIDVTPR